jgi:hypothetical protein
MFSQQITKIENLPNSLQEFYCFRAPIRNIIMKQIIKYKVFTLKSIVTDYILLKYNPKVIFNNNLSKSII